MEKMIYLFIAAGFLSIICLIIELEATEAIEDNSHDYIHWLQSYDNSSVEDFFKVISIGSEFFIKCIGLFLYVPNQNMLGLLCVFTAFFCPWLESVLKMLIAHSRPFWEYSDIIGMVCFTDFGAPSGHALSVGSGIILIYLYYYNEAKILSTIIMGFILALLALDRNYLGAHYYFQIILGYCIAFFVASGVMITKDYIKSIPNNLYKLCIFEFLLFCGMLFSVLLYFFRDPWLDDKWKTNFSNQCSEEFNKDVCLYSSLVETTWLLLLSGFILGVKFQHENINFSWQFYSFIYSLLTILLVSEQAFELIIETLTNLQEFILLCVLRFLVGFTVSAGIPLIASMCFKTEKSEDSDSKCS